MNYAEPSTSWKRIGQEHKEILESSDGWDTFRKTIATRYFTDERYTEADIQMTYDSFSERGIALKETDYTEGGPVHIKVGNQIITQDLLVSASELHSMEQVIDFSTVRKFVEIGGGYGRMALLLLQRYPHIEYTIVDVPPAIDVSRRFLNEKCTVRFVQPNDLDTVGSADVFYSSSVMSELDMDKVQRYFSYVGDHGTFFYIKDWKIGRHTNSVPFLLSLWYRIVNRIIRIFTKNDTEWIFRKRNAYRINENSFPTQIRWKELLHQDCSNMESFSPTHGSLQKAPLFFEIVWNVRSSMNTPAS